jgi:hypothetical protein
METMEACVLLLVGFLAGVISSEAWQLFYKEDRYGDRRNDH